MSFSPFPPQSDSLHYTENKSKRGPEVLINTETLLLGAFPDSRHKVSYAIISHTWGSDADEVSFQVMMPGVLGSPRAKDPGSAKIRDTRQITREVKRPRYAWVDTCCIDKASGVEISEAINSMFKWYQQFVVCFVFLEDRDAENRTFDKCRWWNRGLMHQEFIEPVSIIFYDAN